MLGFPLSFSSKVFPLNNLCLEEKLNILKEKDNCLLNKRSEIISACQHKNRFQVKSLNKERNACYFNDNTPTFPPCA